MAENSNTKKMSESTFWKVVVTILIILLSVFFLFGLIGRAFEILYKNQARRIDSLMGRIFKAGLCKTGKEFRRIAYQKSKILFYKESEIPILILFLTLIFYIVTLIIKGNSPYVSMFELFFKWCLPYDFSTFSFSISSVEGVTLVMPNRVPIVYNFYQIASIIICALTIIGVIWYGVNVAAFIARKNRIKKISLKFDEVPFDKLDLDVVLNTAKATLFNDNDTNEKTGNTSPVSQ